VADLAAEVGDHGVMDWDTAERVHAGERVLRCRPALLAADRTRRVPVGQAVTQIRTSASSDVG
jgi:hypothetical protein